MKNKVLVEKMLIYIEKIEKFMEGTEKYEEFLDNLMLIDACVMNLGQIGQK